MKLSLFWMILRDLIKGPVVTIGYDAEHAPLPALYAYEYPWQILWRALQKPRSQKIIWAHGGRFSFSLCGLHLCPYPKAIRALRQNPDLILACPKKRAARLGKLAWPHNPPLHLATIYGHGLDFCTTTVTKLGEALPMAEARIQKARMSAEDSLLHAFLRQAKSSPLRQIAVESSGRALRNFKLYVAANLLADHLRNIPGRYVPILLPSGLGGVIANLACYFAGKIPVNLNFTLGADHLLACFEKLGTKTALTAGLFLEKTKLHNLDANFLLIEDILKAAPAKAKRQHLFRFLLTPAKHLAPKLDPVATILFSSGTTGDPKGVVLSHHNILCNLESIRNHLHLAAHDRILGCLPFFHSFGFTATMWLPLTSGIMGIYHTSPLEPKPIETMIRQYGATILTSTSTFCRLYAEKWGTKSLPSLRYVIVGAEKLRAPVRDAFRTQFQIELLEGYGCTELSPVVAVNQPPNMIPHGLRQGSVGRPMPAIAIRILDPETKAELPPLTPGLIYVFGNHVMQGYLAEETRTKEAIKDGFYNTGDIGFVDHHGFLHITDRLARFSKIGGEMVPHLKIEDAIQAHLPTDEQVLILGVPNAQKGENLVVLYQGNQDIAKISEIIKLTDLPNLWRPKPEHIFKIDAIPVTATGKIDLKAAKTMALTLAAS